MPPVLPVRLTRTGRRLELRRDEVLFRAGDRARWIYAVETGRIRLERVLSDGYAVTLHTARDGESFAEAALFGECYHCDAVAETASRVVAVDRKEALTALTSDPDAALELARRLAEQVRGLRALLEIRNIRSAEERILRYLRLAPWLDGASGRRPLRAIAAEVGLRDETLYRALARLERRGLVRRRGRRIEIGDGSAET
ncbi:MAG: Crp/Fnr family transcriptional regulator [Thermoanaerobaculia bacterium]